MLFEKCLINIKNSQRMYNQLNYVENTIINTSHNGMLENKMETTPK